MVPQPFDAMADVRTYNLVVSGIHKTGGVDDDLAQIILTRSGASCANYCSWAGYRFKLEPIKPHVLQWLDGRTWDCDESQSVILPIALGYLNFMNPEALPATKEQWTQLLSSLTKVSWTLHYLGERPAQMLGDDGIRKLLAASTAIAKEQEGIPKWKPIDVDTTLYMMVAESAIGDRSEKHLDPILQAVLFAEAICTLQIPDPTDIDTASIEPRAFG